MRLPNFAVVSSLVLAAGLAGAQVVPNYDGARPRSGDAAVPAAGAAAPASAAPAAADPDGLDPHQRALLDGLLERVELRPGGDPRAPALLHRTFVEVVRTRTGAEMTARFIAENARAVVQFGHVENSTVTRVNGKDVLQASGGNTDSSLHPPVITLNQDYLETDPAWRRTELADTLGHELLGHGLQHQEADAAGVTGGFNRYRGNEANAGLIGWLIGVEAGGPTDNDHMWNYIRDPEVYHRSLQTNMAFYAGIFSVEDMRDPLATLAARRAAVEKARQRGRQYRAEMDSWRPVVDHFVRVHGRGAADFRSILDDIDGADARAPLREKDYDQITAYIDKLDANWRGPGAAELATLRRDSESPFFAGTEERLAELRQRLKDETAGRRQEPSVPPVPGQVTWQELYKMRDEDMRDHPDHLPP